MTRRWVLLGAFAICWASGAVAEDEVFKPAVQVRHRFEADNRDLNADRASVRFNLLRTRFGGTFTPNEDIEAFVQLQDSRTMGEETSTLGDGSADAFDLHQGYLRIMDFFDAPLDLQLGRFEVNYGQQRLIGAVGWHNIGRSFDGGILNYHRGSLLSLDMYAFAQVDSVQPGERGDLNVYGFNAAVTRKEDRQADAYLVWQRKNPSRELNRATIGVYVDHKLGPFSYKSDIAYQFGDITPDSVAQNVSAFMVTLDLWWRLQDTAVMSAASVGVDFLSGDDNLSDTDYKVFDTLYATNHKFYGFMDYFLSIPRDTFGRGLVDIHGRVVISLAKNTPFDIKGHIFQAHQDFTLVNSATSKSFGSEVDLTLKHRYNKWLTFVLGGSAFFPGDIFKEKIGDETGYWGYIMTTATM